jgi:quinol monooxygenase YgiN
MIIVTGTILAKPDTFDAMLKLSREHVERWRDEAALRAHFAVPASRAFVKALRDLIVETSGTQIWKAESIER